MQIKGLDALLQTENSGSYWRGKGTGIGKWLRDLFTLTINVLYEENVFIY